MFIKRLITKWRYKKIKKVFNFIDHGRKQYNKALQRKRIR